MYFCLLVSLKRILSLERQLNRSVKYTVYMLKQKNVKDFSMEKVFKKFFKWTKSFQMLIFCVF